MTESSLAKELRRAFPALPLRENEPMKAHCSFRIGGPAEVFAEPADEAELCALWRYLHDLGAPVTVIGNGTNLLVHDEGVRGAVVHLGERFSAIRCENERMFACAGVTLAHLATEAKERGLAGLEFAHGIPGSLGGAVMMNAGAYGGEMKDVVTSVRFLNAHGEIGETADPDFSYRHSRFSDSGELILGASVRLSRDDPAAIHARMMELWAKRSASQPLDRPSAGSTFKRPVSGYAAAMIDAAGLKGASVGGAQVSEKHAGFVINTGSATFADVTALMDHIRETVHDRFGVWLEPEVRII
jgi:UDP-N-acetylmuramate dehydrogenase